ncbi:MAG: CehA/McbA family metallohydrolase [Thermomicrobiales bacterium]
MDVLSPSTPADLVLTGRFEPADERRYRHVSFEVPPGVLQLHVRYDYTDRIPSDPQLRGGNTLDIGLFDERGIESGSPGFRGWSGSNKLAFTVAEEWATPPYRSGAIESGTWQVLLGPYKVSPIGLDYRVELWFNPDLPIGERPSPLPPPLSDRGKLSPPSLEPGWLRGDLHCHTLASDGDSWLIDVLAAAHEAGLDFLGVTDHNAANLPVAPDEPGLPILIPGIEVTTYGGHWNVWGASRWFDFRLPDGEAVAREMAAAAAAGGFVSVNHPRPFGPPWEYGVDLGYHAVEVWNGPWQFLNSACLAHWEAHLRRGQRVVALGGSDTHFLQGEASGPLPRPRLGQPTVWVHVDGEPSAGAILDGLRQGRCFISTSPAGPQLYLTRTEKGVRLRAGHAAGHAALLYSDAGCIGAYPIRVGDWTLPLPFPPRAAYLRAHIVDAAGNVLALTNPLWREEV